MLGGPWGFSPALSKGKMVGAEVQGHPWLLSEFQTSLDDLGPCISNKQSSLYSSKDEASLCLQVAGSELSLLSAEPG